MLELLSTWHNRQKMRMISIQAYRTFGQGFKDMSPPTKELMKLTLEKKLAHGGHPVLRWMMDNIYSRNDPAGNDVSASVYDEHGILFI